MGEFVKGKHPDIFFSWQDSAQLIWNCGLTFHSHFGSTRPYDRDVYETFVWGDLGYWIHTFWRPIVLLISLSVIRGLKARLQRERVEETTLVWRSMKSDQIRPDLCLSSRPSCPGDPERGTTLTRWVRPWGRGCGRGRRGPGRQWSWESWSWEAGTLTGKTSGSVSHPPC